MVFIAQGLTDAVANFGHRVDKFNKRSSARRTAHNQKDLDRDNTRLSQSRGGIAHNNSHAPVGHHRLRGHIDPKVASRGRGGDSRTRVLNNVSVARRMRDNDPINIDRPLG